MHDTKYIDAANSAVAHERAREFTEAGKFWLDAHLHTSTGNKEYCANRAFFCNKFGKILESENGGHN